MSKSYHTFKKGMFTKKLDQKIFIFGRMASNFVRSTFFWIELRNLKKISYLAQFSKFSPEFWHVISNYTYQQVINCNMGSNMAPLIVSMGGPLRPPPMGPTESDRSWEIGLSNSERGKISYYLSSIGCHRKVFYKPSL